MAQSATDSRKALLHIDVFLEKATITLLFSWEKRTQQWKLALLAKEGIQLEIVLNGQPTAVTYPPELVYKKPVKNHNQATECDRKIRNQQLKMTWPNECMKVYEIVILCGDKL